jgi:hypothetical protein
MELVDSTTNQVGSCWELHTQLGAACSLPQPEAVRVAWQGACQCCSGCLVACLPGQATSEHRLWFQDRCAAAADTAHKSI